MANSLKRPLKFSTSHDASSLGNKRQREAQVLDGSNIVSEKIKAIEDFHHMGTRQLRDQAILRGLSSSGSKKELLDRLCAESEKESKNGTPEGKEEDEEKETSNKDEKVTASFNKVTAGLDQYLPDHIKTRYHVLEHGNSIYDATLNQTNVGNNNNKFYLIQALESNDCSKFMVYTRWGRVGIKGQDKLQGPYTSRGSAIQEFEAKFFAKTKNRWPNRIDFICHPKCYTWLETDHDMNKESSEEKPIFTVERQLQVTRLDPRIANFISLICDVRMMKQRMMELGYNAEKLPLGKLSKSTILKGYDVLRRICENIGKSDTEKLEELSGEFYTIIPHDFGFNKMREFTIDNHYKMKCKLEMVEALGEIEIATSLIKDDIYTQEDPLYSKYHCLRCELVPLDVGSKEFSMIEKYMRNTSDETHYRIDIVQIFRASREGENERFKKFSQTKNRMLLWHGSRLTNWTGLRVAPPEAPSTHSLGNGLYFADMFSKSAPYCQANWINSDAVLVLCEVALGDMLDFGSFNCLAKLPKGKLSVKASGRTVPDSSQAQVLEDGVLVPLGKPVELPYSQGTWPRNEYIVFDVDQIRIRYVVHAKFCYQTC
ncbi:PREDICTED: poly [ADP-ribose] polymerase 2-like isoform X3 [Populus euphratica]|uniref:Poly [ADP-ribose] polymerase n=1 Tax=Populus euphratica TaxID=75702 RepID=A0AAJ6Y4E4_POPEU|nr:PREDICTED: poly [ADP-ribose] polymerase 2-like isoform X3 [Populus euphratica]